MRRSICDECPVVEKLGFCPIASPGLRYCSYLGTDLDDDD